MSVKLPREKLFIADFVPLAAAPSNPKLGSVVCADGDAWDPLAAGNASPYLVQYNASDEWEGLGTASQRATKYVNSYGTDTVALTASFAEVVEAPTIAGLGDAAVGPVLVNLVIYLDWAAATAASAKTITLSLQQDDVQVYAKDFTSPICDAATTGHCMAIVLSTVIQFETFADPLQIKMKLNSLLSAGDLSVKGHELTMVSLNVNQLA